MVLDNELKHGLIALGSSLFFVFIFFYIPYLEKKKAGKLDPNQSFLQNLWDAILP
ncbi:MAG: hypothetical protein ACKO3R_00745 [bacterium]